MSPTSGSPVKRAFSGARTNPQFRVNNAKLAVNYRDLGVKLQEIQLKRPYWRATEHCGQWFFEIAWGSEHRLEHLRFNLQRCLKTKNPTKQGARRTGGLAQRRGTGMTYGAVLAVNSDRSANLKPTPDRWGRSGVRALRLWRAPGADGGRQSFDQRFRAFSHLVREMLSTQQRVQIDLR